MSGNAKTSSGKLFADRGFDPITIILQIVALQLWYYASLSAFVVAVDWAAGLRPNMAQLFSSKSLDLSSKYGYPTLIAHCLNVVSVVIAEAKIVEKANKCLDFTLTVVFYHLLLMWLSGFGLPGFAMGWWAINTVIVTATCLLSEMLCMKLETQEIKLSVNDLIEQSKQKASEVFVKVQGAASGKRQKEASGLSV
jgi:hypothetical protein